jgi:hypothetical protein
MGKVTSIENVLAVGMIPNDEIDVNPVSIVDVTTNIGVDNSDD